MNKSVEEKNVEQTEKPKTAVTVKKVRGLMSIKTRIRAGIHCTSCL
jgi:hypothetical protein